MQSESFRFVIFDSLRLSPKSDPGGEKFIYNENSQKNRFFSDFKFEDIILCEILRRF